jgi:lantibiotic leader peptide-processing serine protease
MSRIPLRTWLSLVGTILATTLTIPLTGAPQGQSGSPSAGRQRFIVVAKDGASRADLRAHITSTGGTIVRELAQIGAFVVSGAGAARERVAASPLASGVASDHIFRLIQPANADELLHHERRNPHLRVDPDPAFDLQGLLWNVRRIDAPQAWQTTLGSPSVKVGVADTGLDFTHAELATRVADVVDFTATEDPPLCKTFFGFSDADFAAMFGGPPTTDWNGHGSWIGGNIGAALDAQGINGIAPKVTLVALKISQWCGFAYESEIIDAFLYAADHGIEVVNISFGGYLDRSDPDQELVYQQFIAAVQYARAHGTTIVAAAGNEHVRIGAGGLVLSHGSLTTPGDPVSDLFGLYETPGGIPGVIDVAATNNVVNGSSPACAAGTTGTPSDTISVVCKPASDTHQPVGVGKRNQLAYYSNYGPRIDVAAPGGARKFNLPGYDRGGTPGFPYTTADGTNAWEAFSITSNWALEIPCFVFTGGGFPPDQCYSTIQGTSMAAPHAAAVAALAASAFPILRHRPLLLKVWLEVTAEDPGPNTTRPLSATDLSAGDLTGMLCSNGYCHLGGAAISKNEAYGAGLVNAKHAVGDW